MQRFYADAFFTSTPKVLGLDLKPLTLGHAFVLLAIESPYLSGNKVPDIGDLFAALWICSHDWTAARDSILADTFKTGCVEWSKTKADLSDATTHLQAFTDYLDTYLQVAPRYEQHIKNGEVVGDSSKPVRVPWPLAAAWVLMARMTEQEAWNTPTVRAFAYIAADQMYDENLIMEETPEETPDGNS